MPQRIDVPGLGIVEFPDGMSDADITSAIKRSTERSQQPSRSALQYADDIVRSLAQGVTLGYADELAAKANEFLGRGTYEKNIAGEQARNQQISPAISIPGQIAGAVGGTLAAAPLAAPLAATRVGTALTRLPQAIKYAGTGSALGAIAGSGEAQPGNRLEGAASGALTGAAVGTAAPYIAQGAGRIAGSIANAFSPQASVAGQLGRAMVRDELTPANVAQAMTQAQQIRPGMASIADVGGPNIRGLAERVANTPGAGRTMVESTLTGRQQGQLMRISSDLSNLSGTAKTAREALSDAIATRTATARPLYKTAMQFNAETSPELVAAWQDVTKSGWGRSILGSGELKNNLQTEYGISDIAKAPLMVTIDAWKKTVDGEIGKALRTGDNNKARVLGDMLKKIVPVADNVNPDYAAARNAWAGPSKFIDALDSGRSILGRNQDAAEFAANFSALSASEKEAFRIGAVSSILTKIGSDPAKMVDITKYLRSPQMRDKIAAIMPTPDAAARWLNSLNFEVASSELTGKALGNSATARRLAEQQDAAGIVGDLLLEGIKSVGSGGKSLFYKVLMSGPKLLRDTVRSRADKELADVLLNPARAVDLPAVLARIEARSMPVSEASKLATTVGGEQLLQPSP